MLIFIIYIVFLILLIVLLVLIFKLKIFKENLHVNQPRLIRNGIAGECEGYFVKATDKGAVNSGWFHKKTLILGYNKENERGAATACFRFVIPDKDILAINLTVEAERVHGGLHSHLGPKIKKAKILVNDTIVDDFYLIQKMPNGEDFGYHDVGPIEIDPNLIRNGEFEITLAIENDMAWDIDNVIIRMIVEEERLKTGASMVAGAVISVIFGILPIIIEKFIQVFFK